MAANGSRAARKARCVAPVGALAIEARFVHRGDGCQAAVAADGCDRRSQIPVDVLAEALRRLGQSHSARCGNRMSHCRHVPRDGFERFLVAPPANAGFGCRGRLPLGESRRSERHLDTAECSGFFRMTFLERVCRALCEAEVDYAIVGGHAVALHGAVRGTVDVDVAVRWARDVVVRAEAALLGIGLVSSIPVTAQEIFDNRDAYMQERNLVAWNFHHPDVPMDQVDLIISYDLAHKRVETLALPSGPIRLLSIRDLIDMKRQSHRPQDIEDVAALERLQ